MLQFFLELFFSLKQLFLLLLLNLLVIVVLNLCTNDVKELQPNLLKEKNMHTLRQIITVCLLLPYLTFTNVMIVVLMTFY